MSKKRNTRPAEIAEQTETADLVEREAEAAELEQGAVVAAAPAEAEEKRPAPVVKRVYCGPTVRGVAKQYTVYIGDIPAALADFMEKHPEAKALVVPVEQFAQTRTKMETAGTVEAILYNKIKSNL